MFQTNPHVQKNNNDIIRRPLLH